MLKAIIIDDERSAIDALQDVLEECGGVEISAAFVSPAAALDALRGSREQVDVVFLDIEMPGVGGLELAAALPDICPEASVVFTTAYDQYALEAFEVNAVDYLLKPVRRERLAKTIAKVEKGAAVTAAAESPGEGRIVCFGSFRILVSPGPLEQIKWRTSKVRELFAYLVHHRGESIHKGKIVEDLWPHFDAERAFAYLHTCIYQIRKTIRACRLDDRLSVSYNNDSYSFAMRGVSLDTDEFLRIAERRDNIAPDTVAEFEYAATLYRGNYLEEDDFLWAAPAKQKLLLVYIELARAMADCYMRTGQYARAAFHLREMLAKDPLQEESHRLLLTCLAEFGDRAALMLHYREMERLFHVELGVPPGPETQELYRRLTES